MVVGCMNISPSEMVGNSSGNPPAAHTPRFTASATLRRWSVAVVQLAPGIADADDRLVLEDVGGEAFGAQPGAPREVFVGVAAVPFLAAKFAGRVGGHEVLLERAGKRQVQ